MRINDRGGNPGPLIPNLAEPSMILWKVGGLWVCSEPAGWAPVRARGCSALPGALAGPERWVRPRAAPARGRSSPCAPTAPSGLPGRRPGTRGRRAPRCRAPGLRLCARPSPPASLLPRASRSAALRPGEDADGVPPRGEDVEGGPVRGA